MDAFPFVFLLFFFHLVFLNFALKLIGVRVKGYGFKIKDQIWFLSKLALFYNKINVNLLF